MVLLFTYEEIEVSPYLHALVRAKDSGIVSVDMHDDAIKIDTNEFSRIEWLAYAQYLLTGDICVDDMHDILSFMGHTYPSDEAPEAYRRAYMKDIWGSNKGIDGLCNCHMDNIRYSSYHRLYEQVVMQENVVDVIKGRTLDHLHICSDEGGRIWFTHVVDYMIRTNTICVDGSRLRDYDIEDLSMHIMHGRNINIIDADRNIWDEMGVCTGNYHTPESMSSVIDMLILMGRKDKAIYLLCRVQYGYVRRTDIPHDEVTLDDIFPIHA